MAPLTPSPHLKNTFAYSLPRSLTQPHRVALAYYHLQASGESGIPNPHFEAPLRSADQARL